MVAIAGMCPTCVGIACRPCHDVKSNAGCLRQDRSANDKLLEEPKDVLVFLAKRCFTIFSAGGGQRAREAASKWAGG